MPRRRKSPAELLTSPEATLADEDPLDREAAVSLDRILTPVRQLLGRPETGSWPYSQERFRQIDLAFDVDASPQTISYVLGGHHWPNLHLLLQMLEAVEHRLVTREVGNAQ